MKISRVRIENYRSIQSLELQANDFNAFIGENNCGKSNILKAISLVLGETWPSERSFAEEDFHNFDKSKEIVIQIYFDQVIAVKRTVDLEVAGFELRCGTYKIRTKDKPAGTIWTDYRCIDVDGKVPKYPASPPKPGSGFKGIPWYELKVSGELREQIPLIFVDVLRDYSDHEPKSRYSVLRRLFKDVHTEFVNPKSTVEMTVDGRKVKVPRKEAFEAAIRQAYTYLKTDGFTEIESSLATNTLEQMGIDPEHNSLSLHFDAYDPQDVYKNIELYVRQLGITTSARDVGAGLQSAIVIALFRTYQELRKQGAVFAIEEPEVFLHPQKSRYFASILRSLADKGNQVFLTTHSPVFVSIDRPEGVICVRRAEQSGTATFQAKIEMLAANERQELRLISEFDSQRNELFFAKKVLFVEGNTEKVAVPLILRALGIDVNKEGFSIIECGGKTKIGLFAKVAKAFGIPHFILADEDDPDDSDHRKWNEQLRTVGGSNIAFLVPDFDKVSGLSGSDSVKVDNAMKKYSSATRDEIPEAIKSALERFVACT